MFDAVLWGLGERRAGIAVAGTRNDGDEIDALCWSIECVCV